MAADNGAFDFTAAAFVGAAAVAALATRAATNFAAAAFVCAAFSAAALRASAALTFADAAFLSVAEGLVATGLAAAGLAAAGLADTGFAFTALSTGLEVAFVANLDAGLVAGFEAGALEEVGLEAVDLAFALATTVFAAGFSTVRAVFFATLLAVDLPRAAAAAEAVRAAALADLADVAFAAVPEWAVERVALRLAALAAALTVRTGAGVALRLVEAARAVVAALPLPAVALLDVRAVVRLTAAFFDVPTCSRFAPLLADLALFLALFVDMRSTLLIASAAQAADAEPKGQRRRRPKVASVTMETSKSTRAQPIRQTPAVRAR